MSVESGSITRTETSYVKPFVRWAGGKSRLLRRILPLIPSEFDDYYEPFLGGGAVFFAVKDRASGRAHLSDLNQNLISAWQVMGTHPESLVPYFNEFLRRDGEDFYYEMRASIPDTTTERAARFLYLNGTSWNHLWRENSRTGAMNTPWGKRPFKGFDPKRLEEIHEALADVEIQCRDFREALAEPKAGDFVYLDPPYLPIFTNPEEKEATSKFNKYTAKVFGRSDLLDLVSICDDLTSRGVRWVMSNRDTPGVRHLFSGYRIERFTTTRSLAAQNKRTVEAKNSPEALIIGERA